VTHGSNAAALFYYLEAEEEKQEVLVRTGRLLFFDTTPIA
jgi:hypothetical protein